METRRLPQRGNPWQPTFQSVTFYSHPWQIRMRTHQKEKKKRKSNAGAHKEPRNPLQTKCLHQVNSRQFARSITTRHWLDDLIDPSSRSVSISSWARSERGTIPMPSNLRWLATTRSHWFHRRRPHSILTGGFGLKIGGYRTVVKGVQRLINPNWIIHLTRIIFAPLEERQGGPQRTGGWRWTRGGGRGER